VKAMGDRRDAGFERLVEREMSRAAASPEACPQVELLAAWFDRALNGAEAEAVQTHLASCARCQELLGTLARTEPAVLYVHEQAEPARHRRWAWHLRWAVPVAAAAIVVVAVALQSPLQAPAAKGPTALAPAVSSPAPSSMPAESIVARQMEAPSAGEAAPAVPPAREVPAQASGGGAQGQDQRPRGQLKAMKDEVAAGAPAAASEGFAPSPPAPLGGVVASLPAAPPRPPLQERVEEKADATTREDRAVAAPAAAQENAVVTQRAAASTRSRLTGFAADAKGLPPVFAPGGRVGWRVLGALGVARSDDGGSTWTEQVLPAGVRVQLIVPVSPLVCWAAGPAGALVRTLDGVTWKVIAPPVRADLVALTAASDSRATVRTADGTTYETDDGGAAWRRR